MKRRHHAPKKLRPKVLLAFARARVERHQEISGVRCAVLPFRTAPDLHVGRETPLSESQRNHLLQRYVLCEGLPQTIRDDHGCTFFAIPDRETQAGAA